MFRMVLPAPGTNIANKPLLFSGLFFMRIQMSIQKFYLLSLFICNWGLF